MKKPDCLIKSKESMEYDDLDIERLSLILTLKKAGVHIENILKYIQLDEQGQSTSIQKIRILKQERNNILDEIHQRQKNLDTLDCLIYKLKEENNENKQ